MPFWLQETIGGVSLLIIMASVLVLQLAVAKDNDVRPYEASSSNVLVASSSDAP